MGEALLARLGRSPDTPEAKDGDDKPPARTGIATGVAPFSLGYFEKTKTRGLSEQLARRIEKEIGK
jgi:hypothetical protein